MAGFIPIGTFEKKIGIDKSEKQLKRERFYKGFEKNKERAQVGVKLTKTPQQFISSVASDRALGRRVYRGNIPKSKMTKRFF